MVTFMLIQMSINRLLKTRTFYVQEYCRHLLISLVACRNYFESHTEKSVWKILADYITIRRTYYHY